MYVLGIHSCRVFSSQKDTKNGPQPYSELCHAKSAPQLYVNITGKQIHLVWGSVTTLASEDLYIKG